MRDRIIAACLAACIAGPAPAATPAAERAFDDGVAAYRSGHYESALDAFRTAQRRGIKDTNLTLNLGLTLFKLGRYTEARGEFMSARTDLRYTSIADYHLGLIDLALGNRESALNRFAAVEAFTDLPNVGAHAGAALRDFSNIPPPTEPIVATRGAMDYLRLASGYDSNPELIGDSLDRPGENAGAGYAEIIGAIEHPVYSGSWGTTRLNVEGGLRQYADSEGFDRESGSAGLSQGGEVGDWQIEGGANVGTAWLEWETYQNTWGVSFDGRVPAGATALHLTAGSDRISGQQNFVYLDGWRHRLALEAARFLGLLRARLGLEVQRDDRRDLAQGGEFSSYSPTRYGAALGLGGMALGRTTLEWRARVRNSRYADPDRFIVGGTLVEQERVDTLAATGLRARYRGGQSWSWIIDYEYSHNVSTIPDFRYARHEVALGIEWLR